jgi:hypothetical protein
MPGNPAACHGENMFAVDKMSMKDDLYHINDEALEVRTASSHTMIAAVFMVQ